MVERGPLKQPKIKKLSKEQAADKATQTKDKAKPLQYCDIVTLFSDIIYSHIIAHL